MTSQATLLCSTRCQVIATYDVYSRMEQVLGALPKELVRIFKEYYGHADIPRSQENNSQARWQQLRDNPLFQSIALTTDLFRFAIHGLEKRLPQNLGERFRFIEQRIPTLYPRIRCLAFEAQPHKETTIPSPLDLPRIPPVISSDSFDPYHPERWSVSQGKWLHSNFVKGVPFWQQRCTSHEVTATHAIDRDQHLPNGNPTALDEQFLLGSILTPQGAVFCRLLFQDISFGGSVDTLTVDTRRENNETLHELSWLPLARAAFKSTPFKREAEVDWILYASTGVNSTKEFDCDFTYIRVQDRPDADITDADFLRAIDAKLPEGTTLTDHYGSSRTNVPPSSATATAQRDASSAPADFLRAIDAKLPEDTTLADHYGTSRTNAPPSSATATAQRDASSAPARMTQEMIQGGLDLLESRISKDFK